MWLYDHHDPFPNKTDDLIEELAQYVILLALISALLLRTNAFSKDIEGPENIAISLGIIILIVLFLAFILHCLLVEMSPKYRHYFSTLKRLLGFVDAKGDKSDTHPDQESEDNNDTDPTLLVKKLQQVASEREAALKEKDMQIKKLENDMLSLLTARHSTSKSSGDVGSEANNYYNYSSGRLSTNGGNHGSPSRSRFSASSLAAANRVGLEEDMIAAINPMQAIVKKANVSR